MAFSSSEKSHFKFISIIMSLVNNFVRKIYLHTSHLCFHVIFEFPINNGFLRLIKVIIPRAVTLFMALAACAQSACICATMPEGRILQDAQHSPGHVWSSPVSACNAQNLQDEATQCELRAWKTQTLSWVREGRAQAGKDLPPKHRDGLSRLCLGRTFTAKRSS